MSADEPPILPLDNPIAPTDYATFVTDILAHHSRKSDSPTIDQDVLRRCVNLASSFLLTDSTSNPEGGIATWSAGFNRLVDLIVVLHRRDELELETVNAASRACSECWTAAGNWRTLSDCRTHVRDLGERLKKILDANKRTYRAVGERIYAP